MIIIYFIPYSFIVFVTLAVFGMIGESVSTIPCLVTLLYVVVEALLLIFMIVIHCRDRERTLKSSAWKMLYIANIVKVLILVFSIYFFFKAPADTIENGTDFFSFLGNIIYILFGLLLYGLGALFCWLATWTAVGEIESGHDVRIRMAIMPLGVAIATVLAVNVFFNILL